MQRVREDRSRVHREPTHVFLPLRLQWVRQPVTKIIPGPGNKTPLSCHRGLSGIIVVHAPTMSDLPHVDFTLTARPGQPQSCAWRIRAVAGERASLLSAVKQALSLSIEIASQFHSSRWQRSGISPGALNDCGRVSCRTAPGIIDEGRLCRCRRIRSQRIKKDQKEVDTGSDIFENDFH